MEGERFVIWFKGIKGKEDEIYGQLPMTDEYEAYLTPLSKNEIPPRLKELSISLDSGIIYKLVPYATFKDGVIVEIEEA